MHKYLGILDYALRVFSKGFPIHEIILNISTLFTRCTAQVFTKLRQKIKSLEGPRRIDEGKKNQPKIKETAYHFSKTSCDLSSLSARPSLESMWN